MHLILSSYSRFCLQIFTTAGVLNDENVLVLFNCFVFYGLYTYFVLPGVGSMAVTVNVNKPPPRSADPSMTIGWLNVQSLTNKIDVVTKTIADHSLDVFARSETWHSGCDDARLRLATPAGYAVVDVARATELSVEEGLLLSTVGTSRVREYCSRRAPRSKRSASD